MKNATLILLALSLTACGTDVSITKYVEVPTPGPTVVVTAPAVPPVVLSAYDQALQDIAGIVADENAYREGLGQTYLTSGLSCTLYTITGGQYIQNDSAHSPTLTGITQVATFLHKSVFNQENSSSNDGLNILPAALKNNPVYFNLILLRCTGQVVVRETDYHQFDLASDDGSVLYIDGSRLIDADGNHGITNHSGTRYLRRGVHTIRLDYAQTGAGNQALILKQDGDLLSGSYLFH